MKTYKGTKVVQAKPMNEATAVKLGYTRSNNNNHEWREGYHVLYPDGYNSWSLKNVFESAYVLVETFVDRLICEKRELDEKRAKLLEFIKTQKFDSLTEENKELLCQQLDVMKAYSVILEERISLNS